MKRIESQSPGKHVKSGTATKLAVVPMIKRRLAALGYKSTRITLLIEIRSGVFQFNVLAHVGGKEWDHIGYWEFDAAHSPNFGDS